MLSHTTRPLYLNREDDPPARGVNTNSVQANNMIVHAHSDLNSDTLPGPSSNAIQKIDDQSNGQLRGTQKTVCSDSTSQSQIKCDSVMSNDTNKENAGRSVPCMVPLQNGNFLDDI